MGETVPVLDAPIAEVATASIAARLDALPRTWPAWRLILLVSLGGCFEFYDLMMTAYISPGLVHAGVDQPRRDVGGHHQVVELEASAQRHQQDQAPGRPGAGQGVETRGNGGRRHLCYRRVKDRNGFPHAETLLRSAADAQSSSLVPA